MKQSEGARGGAGPVGLALVLLLTVATPLAASEGSAAAWARLQVFDPGSGSLIFDTGVVPAAELVRRTGEMPSHPGPLTFEVRTWTESGRMVTDRAAGVADLGGLISFIGFESIPLGALLQGGSITLDGPVDVTGGLSVAGALSAGTFQGPAGSPFFSSCVPGQALRALHADGTVTCEAVGGGVGDNLGDHVATQNLSMSGFWLSHDGDPEGVMVSPAGAVGIGAANPLERLEVGGNVRLAAGSNVYFGPGTTTRLTETSGNVTIFAHLNDFSDISFSAEDNVEIESDDDVFILPEDDVFIEPNGGVAFGNVNNPSRLITVEQGTTRDPIADQWDTYSSLRWKTDIRPIEAPLELLGRLQGVRYRSLIDGKSTIGLIAEHVGEVLPEIVTWEKEGVWAESIAYDRLVALLIESGKEQARRLEALGAELAALRRQLEAPARSRSSMGPIGAQAPR